MFNPPVLFIEVEVASCVTRKRYVPSAAFEPAVAVITSASLVVAVLAVLKMESLPVSANPAAAVPRLESLFLRSVNILVFIFRLDLLASNFITGRRSNAINCEMRLFILLEVLDEDDVLNIEANPSYL